MEKMFIYCRKDLFDTLFLSRDSRVVFLIITSKAMQCLQLLQGEIQKCDLTF